ncbi:MAG TPA: response regulator [Gemmataceae bacterium]|nr:response regulator [Gemmataceae bacterium]
MPVQDRHPARRVLVVDDSPFSSGMLAALLRKEGHEVQVAEDGEEALLRLRWWHPDLILLDLTMPVMDGWEFLRLRAEDPATAAIPVVVLSATDESLFKVASGLGAGRCLKKPLRADDVLAAVRECCPR